MSSGLDRLLGLPGQTAELLQTLPTLAKNTTEMVRHTAWLPQVAESLERVASDTSSLPQVAESLDRVASDTSWLPQVADALERVASDTSALPQMRDDVHEMAEAVERIETQGVTQLDSNVAELREMVSAINGRMVTVEDSMPTLVDVQRDLSKMPDTMTKIESHIGDVSGLLERLLDLLDTVGQSIESLQEAATPLGRMAQKLPGSGKPSDD